MGNRSQKSYIESKTWLTVNQFDFLQIRENGHPSAGDQFSYVGRTFSTNLGKSENDQHSKICLALKTAMVQESLRG